MRSGKQYTKKVVREPAPAIGWICKYVDKQTNQEKSYIKVIIKADLLKNAAGDITLLGFKQVNKKKNEHPDLIFKKSQPKKESKQQEGDLPF